MNGLSHLYDRLIKVLLLIRLSREERRCNGRVKYLCRCSFYEIFNERVFDLLDAGCSLGGLQVSTCPGAGGGVVH